MIDARSDDDQPTHDRRVPDNASLESKIEELRADVHTLGDKLDRVCIGLRIALDLDVTDPRSIRAAHTTQDMRAMIDQAARRVIGLVVAAIVSFVFSGAAIVASNIYGPTLRAIVNPPSIEQPVHSSSLVGGR